MGDKPPSKTTHTFLRRSTPNIVSKTSINKPTLNPPQTSKQVNQNLKMTPTQPPSTTNNSNLTNENCTQKTFAETTANLSFPKKNQAIIFNTIDGIPQIEYIKAISLITNPSNIKFASRISNNRFCIYFANSNIVNDIINRCQTITVDNNNIELRRLENQAKRIIISNVSPIIPHTYITDALNLIGINTLTPITFLKAGFSTDDLSHIISFRRQTHIKFEDTPKLPGSLVIHFENTDYRIFLTDDTLTCYLCKRTGHTSAHCKNTSEQNKNPPSSQTVNLPSQLELNTNPKTNIDNTNDSATLYTEDNQNTNDSATLYTEDNQNTNDSATLHTEDNQNTYLEQTSKPEKLNYTPQINEHPHNNIQIIDSSQELLPPNITHTTQFKRQISDSSSQKTKTPPSPQNTEKIKIKKKPKIRSRSNSSTRPGENNDEAFKPIELFFDENQNSPINFLQFKHILEQSTNKHINIHSLCQQVGIDIISLISLIEEIRPNITKDKTMKSRLTKFANLLFQVLPPQDTQTQL